MMYVPCGEKEIAYLKSKDKKLAAVIESLGVLEPDWLLHVFQV